MQSNQEQHEAKHAAPLSVESVLGGVSDDVPVPEVAPRIESSSNDVSQNISDGTTSTEILKACRSERDRKLVADLEKSQLISKVCDAAQPFIYGAGRGSDYAHLALALARAERIRREHHRSWERLKYLLPAAPELQKQKQRSVL